MRWLLFGLKLVTIWPFHIHICIYRFVGLALTGAASRTKKDWESFEIKITISWFKSKATASTKQKTIGSIKEIVSVKEIVSTNKRNYSNKKRSVPYFVLNWLLFRSKLVTISSFHIHICIYRFVGLSPNGQAAPLTKKDLKEKINYHYQQKQTVSIKKLFQ